MKPEQQFVRTGREIFKVLLHPRRVLDDRIATGAGAVEAQPCGIGAVEAGLTAGLTAAGVPVAVSAVLLFRLLTFWLTIPFGWAP